MKKIRLSTHPPNEGGFTMVEIMIVVAIIALLTVMATPALIRARKRSQAGSIKGELRLIDHAVEQYGSENGLKVGSACPIAAWRIYMKPNSRLYSYSTNLFGEPYGDQKVGSLPTVPGGTWDMLIDVCDSSFWAPYQRATGP